MDMQATNSILQNSCGSSALPIWPNNQSLSIKCNFRPAASLVYFWAPKQAHWGLKVYTIFFVAKFAILQFWLHTIRSLTLWFLTRGLCHLIIRVEEGTSNNWGSRRSIGFIGWPQRPPNSDQRKNEDMKNKRQLSGDGWRSCLFDAHWMTSLAWK